LDDGEMRAVIKCSFNPLPNRLRSLINLILKVLERQLANPCHTAGDPTQNLVHGEFACALERFLGNWVHKLLLFDIGIANLNITRAGQPLPVYQFNSVGATRRRLRESFRKKLGRVKRCKTLQPAAQPGSEGRFHSTETGDSPSERLFFPASL